MRVLVVGGGGREHALVWRLRQGRTLERLWCAPGNAGIAALAECVPIAPDDVAGLVRFAREQGVDMTVVGPELPLTLGLVDRLLGGQADEARYVLDADGAVAGGAGVARRAQQLVDVG